MNTFQRRAALVPWLIALAAVLSPSMGPGTNVLCIAEGNHVSLERLSDGCCPTPKSEAGHRGDPCLDGGDCSCCSGCVDLLVDHDGLQSQRPHLATATSDCSRTVLGDNHHRPPSRSLALSWSETDCGPPDLPRLASVVLLA